MIANYHMHTWRCNHATGNEREYIEAAIGHYQIIGFSDHTPYPFPDGLVDPDKMRMNQLEDYVDTILKLREEYKDDIEIHLGLEVEYYPAYFDELVRYASRFPIEYFLLGQHWLGNRFGEPSSFAETKDEKLLERYVTQVICAMETGCFTYLAHPDVLHFTGDPEAYDFWMRKLCKMAKRMQMPMEINLLGITTQRNYPNPAFWKIAGEEGCTAIFGADAHRADFVWNPEGVKIAEQIAAENHLRVLQAVELNNPFKEIP